MGLCSQPSLSALLSAFLIRKSLRWATTHMMSDVSAAIHFRDVSVTHLKNLGGMGSAGSLAGEPHQHCMQSRSVICLLLEGLWHWGDPHDLA